MKTLRIISCAAVALFWGPTGLQADTKVTGEIEAGYQKLDLSANEAKFDTYGEVPDGLVIPNVQIKSESEHDTVTFEGKNLRQDNQSMDLNYNHNYRVKVDASWDETPHKYSNVARTLYDEVSPGNFRLPDQIQSALTGSTPGSATLNNQLASYWTGAHIVPLGIQDKKGTVNMSFASGQHMKSNFGISVDKIEGHKAAGASFAASPGGTVTIQLPQPVDWKVYNVHSGTEYNTKKVQLGVNYQMSAFQNNVETLIWDNPIRLAGGAGIPDTGKMNLAPDNWSQTVSLNSGFNLPASTRLTAKGSMGYMRQNQSLLPFTTNSSLAVPAGGWPAGVNPALLTDPAGLPEETANAKMVTWTQDYALTNRSIHNLGLGAKYHSYQLVNRTAEFEIGGIVPADYAYVKETTSNNHFQYRKDSIEGSADYQLLKPWAIGVRYGTEWTTRNDRETRNVTEKTLTVTSDLKPAAWTTLRGTYVRAHRRPQDLELDDYRNDDNPAIFGEQPGLRRYDVADRLRNQGKVLWEISAGAVSLGFNGSLTHDNYQPGAGDVLGSEVIASTYIASPNMYGLLETRDVVGGVDFGIDVTERLSFDGYYNYEETKSLQRNSEDSITGRANSGVVTQLPTNDWNLQSVDRYHIFGASARVGRSADRVSCKLGYDVVMSRGANNYISNGSLVFAPLVNGNTTTGTLVSPSDTKYMKQDISLKTNVKVNARVSVVVGYLYEKFDVSDWQYQNMSTVTGGSVRTTAGGNGQTNILLANNVQNYVAHVGSVVMKYKF